MYADKYFEVEPGVKLRYIDEGQGRPLLFVPGWSFSADSYVKQIDYFKTKFRCIAIDPRSHGKSTITRNGNSYDCQGDDLAKLMDYLSLKDVVIVGWSFGALACWAYAEKYGFSNIAASITVDNSPRSISDDECEYRAGTLDNLRGDHKNAFVSKESFRAFMEGFADGLLFENPMDSNLRQELVETSCRIPCDVADMLYVDGWLGDKREVVKKLDEKVPSLLFIANYRKDAGVPYMQKNYPNTEIHAFGMHMMFREYPEKFNAIMESFIESKLGK